MNGSTYPEVKAFLFDMGDVLIKFSHARMFIQLSEVLERPVDEVKHLFQETGLFVGYDRGDIDDDEAISRIETFVGRPIDHRALQLAMSNIFEPSPRMFELLTELKRRGFRMVLLSNTCRPHIEFVRERFPIYRLLDDYVLSFEVRAMKPEAAIFNAAIAKAGVPPENCFYTDDIPKFVEAGRTHGLQAEVFTGVDNLKRQLAERGIEV